MFLFQRVTVSTLYFSCISASTDLRWKNKNKTNNNKKWQLQYNSIHWQYQITEKCKTTGRAPAHTSSKIHECIFHSVELLRQTYKENGQFPFLISSSSLLFFPQVAKSWNIKFCRSTVQNLQTFSHSSPSPKKKTQSTGIW